MRLCKLIHLRWGNLHKRSHLVDKGAGSARAGAVHAHFKSAGEKKNFCVLAAELYNGIGSGIQSVHGNLSAKTS